MAVAAASMIVNDGPPMLQGLTNAPLGCHMRLYTYKIIQSDVKGIIQLK